MWNDIVTQLAKFPTAVLTAVDPDGYPFSIRCTPQIDRERQVLRIPYNGETCLKPGPAGLLCHFHNDQLWDLKSFQVLGQLEQAEGSWVFHPERFIPGNGLLGPLDQMKSLFKARADAKKYLQKRGLPRPKVHWDEINQVKAEAKNGH